MTVFFVLVDIPDDVVLSVLNEGEAADPVLDVVAVEVDVVEVVAPVGVVA